MGNSRIIISGLISNKCVRRFAEELFEAAQEPDAIITVVINSPGGVEHCGRAIAGMIRSARNCGQKIDTLGYGAVHSSAVLIFAAGECRRLSKFASIMVHESSDAVKGSASAIKKFAKQMERDEHFWCDCLGELTGTDSKIWMKLHFDETYLQPQQALELNLATELI